MKRQFFLLLLIGVCTLSVSLTSFNNKPVAHLKVKAFTQSYAGSNHVPYFTGDYFDIYVASPGSSTIVSAYDETNGLWYTATGTVSTDSSGIKWANGEIEKGTGIAMQEVALIESIQ